MREPAKAAQSPTVAEPDRRALRGRQAEIGAIERLLNEVRTGSRAGVMTIVGDVGLGKSALLEHAIAAANGMRVLRCVGDRWSPGRSTDARRTGRVLRLTRGRCGVGRRR